MTYTYETTSTDKPVRRFEVNQSMKDEPLRTDPEIEGLRLIVRRGLSRRAYRHYHGFATGQLREFKAAAGAPAKKILYVLRTTLTGTHLLRTGEVQTDVTKLLDSYGFADAHELVTAKRAGERVRARSCSSEIGLTQCASNPASRLLARADSEP